MAVLLATWPLAFGEPVTAREQLQQVTPRGVLDGAEQAVVDLFEQTSPAVVYITTLAERPNFVTGLMQQIPRGTGTGFVWDLNGHIVTNYHVIAEAASGARVQVVLADQSTHDAIVVGASPQHDLAVVRIQPPPGLQAVTIGDSESLHVGQSVYAIGNPFGLSASLSSGIVSALDRQIQSVSNHRIEAVIQIDATINPGNSGGPLLDSAGRVIGVNTAIASRTGESAGIGFAIPIDTVRRVVPALVATGEYAPPALGVETRPRVSASIVRRLGTSGVLVLTVSPGSGAAEAGIRGSQMRGNSLVPGDVVQAIDGTPVGSLTDLQTVLDRYRRGDVVRVTLWRNGRTAEVNVKLS
jgi:S1-C subfamily serine protease